MGADELVIFTERYPFGQGETFLATEVPYLAERFRRVRVVPLHAEPEPARPLPDGWALDRTLDAIRRGRGWIPRGAPVALAALRGELGAPGTALASARPYPAARRVLRFIRTAGWIRRWYERSASSLAPGTVAYAYWFEAGAFGLATLRRLGAPLALVARAHNWDLYEGSRGERFFPFRGWTLEAFDAVFPVSEHGVQHLRSRFGDQAGSVRLARLGVEPSPAAPASSDGVLRITTCSHLLARKRIDRLVEALARLARRAPEQRVVWRHLGDGPEGARLRALASARLPPPITVEWRGHQPHDEVLRILATETTDVFINVSEREGVPVSIMEALAASIPVLATGVGGTAEIVDEEVGACLDPWDAEAAAKALLRIGHPDLNPELRAAARARWAERCSAPKSFRAFAGGLAELAERRTALEGAR